jgi:hypothetical protein
MRKKIINFAYLIVFVLLVALALYMFVTPVPAPEWQIVATPIG